LKEFAYPGGTVDTRVKNLKRIWNLKKNEIGFIQSEVAKKIGMTQGAISQYLNEFTVLNPPVIIKFANFLGVDPREIDPDILNYLPDVATANLIYNWSDAEKRIDEASTSIIFPNKMPAKVIRLDKPLHYSNHGTELKLPKGAILWVLEEEPSSLFKDPKSTSLWVISRKGSPDFEVVNTKQLPPKSLLKLRYFLHGARLF
tara:strand:+ start:13730 stop:14332 length:603 start_codon:yes stop_codon:yes gene_type:complete